MMTSSPAAASSAATTPPPAPEPMTTASHARSRSRAMSSRPKTFAGLGMPHLAVERGRRDDIRLVPADGVAVAVEAAARDLGDPRVGVELEARLHRRLLV